MAIAFLGYRVDSDQVARAERRLGRMSGAAGLAARAAAGFAAAAAAAFSVGQLINTVSEFETSISRVGAVSRASSIDMESMRETAMRLGSTTEFTAAQAADGLGFLAMAGFSARESIEALPPVLDLATASGMGLASAADIASNVISGFGLAAGDASNVADVLAAASSRANTDVSQLGRAMSTVAPISAALGVSIEDTAAAIGVVSDAGIQGERAGTALRGVMASLAGPTDEARDALARYGVTLEQVNPETNTLSEIFATLQESGLSTADAMTIFGREAASAALVMVEANGRLGELGQELRGVEGAANDAATIMRDNLGGDINALMSAVSGLVLALGDAGLTAVLRTLTQVITAVIRGFTGIVDAVGVVTSAVSEFVDAIFSVQDVQERLEQGQRATEEAIDNSSIAMGDQIRAAARLEARLGSANVMTRQTAEVNLASAEARLEDFHAMQRQNRELARSELGLDDVSRRIASRMEALADAQSRLTALDLQDLEEFGMDFTNFSIEEVRALERELVSLLNQQQVLADAFQDMEFATPEQLAAQEQTRLNIEQIRSALEAATGEVIDLNGNVTDGVEFTSRLSSAIGSIDFSNSIQGAMALAAELGVSFTRAMQIAGLVGAAAQARADAENPIFDPRDPRYNAEAAEYASTLERTRNAMDDLSQSANIVVPGVTDVQTALTATASAAGGAAGGLRDATEAGETMAEAFRGRLESAIGSVADAFGDFVMRGFKDFRSFARSVLDTFRNMLSEMISMAVRNRIMVSLGISGGGATPALAGGGGGGLLSGLGGGNGGILSAFTGGSGLLGLGGGSGLLGLGAGSGLASGIGSLGVGAGLASTLSMAIPVIGGLVAAFSFFRTKTKELDAGLRVSVEGMDTLVQSFRTVEKSRFWGLSKKVSTTMGEASDAVANPIVDAMAEMQGASMEAARVFGFGSSIFRDFSASFQISLKGLSEDEKLKKINEELQRMGNEFASIVPNFENMNDLINAANQAVTETAALGGTRFESEVLAAARRRGEVTTVRGGPGFSDSQSLLRLQELKDLEGKVEENTRQNNSLTKKLVDIFERWEEVGIPRGPVLT